MTPVETVIQQLTALTVSGITYHAAGNLPERIDRAQLPALLLMASADTAEAGFQASAFGDGTHTVTLHLTHLMLVAPAHATRGDALLTTVAPYIDRYLAALRQDVMLGDTVALPLQVSVKPGVIPYGGTDYRGCRFHYTLVLEV